nr:immunoglobulin light chain junction region [Macaca mulatta]
EYYCQVWDSSSDRSFF